MSLAFEFWQPDRDYRVVEVDSPSGAGALLLVTGNHRLLRISNSLATRLRVTPLMLNSDEQAEWNILAAIGILSDINKARLATAVTAEGATLALNVNLTSVCNLRCSYCFADGGDYGRLRGNLDASTVAAMFRFITDQRLQPGNTLRFEFFGGEPLLNVDRIAEICRWSEEYEQISGVQVIYRISTNLTVLPEAAVDLFVRRRFIISVAIDGARETHDRNRPYKNGQGSYDRILDNCFLLRASGDDVTLVARMTVVTDGGRSLLENIRQLWSLNVFDYFQIYPAVTPDVTAGRPSYDSSVGLRNPRMPSADYVTQLSEVLGYYPRLFSPGNRFQGILEWEQIAEMVLEGKLALSYCSAGRNYFTFSPDRSIMPCHRMVGNIEFQVGSVDSGLDRALDGAGVSVWRRSVDENEARCSHCWMRYFCGGGCKQENFITTGELARPSLESCAHQTHVVENVLRLIEAQGAAYRKRDRRRLRDLFVSCGRPVTQNLRSEPAAHELRIFQYLQPVT